MAASLMAVQETSAKLVSGRVGKWLMWKIELLEAREAHLKPLGLTSWLVGWPDSLA